MSGEVWTIPVPVSGCLGQRAPQTGQRCRSPVWAWRSAAHLAHRSLTSQPTKGLGEEPHVPRVTQLLFRDRFELAGLPSHQPTSGFPETSQPTGGGRALSSGEGTREGQRARKGTGSGEKRGTYQFLLESLFEFQHPLLHLLYGLRQTPPPAKSHLLHAHSTIFKVPRTTEQPATPLGPYTPVIRHGPVS